MRPACVFFRASVRNVLISVDVHERRFTDCLAIKITPDFLLRAPYTQVGVQMPTENAHEKTMYSDEKLKIECANKKGDRSRPANKKHRPRGSTTGRAKSDVESIRRAFWGVQPSRRGAIVLRPRNVRHQTKKVARKPPPKMKSPGQTGTGAKSRCDVSHPPIQAEGSAGVKSSTRCTDRTIVRRVCCAFAGCALLIVIEHEQTHRRRKIT
jgi:hypothetical protein